jgi:hypothetical protein
MAEAPESERRLSEHALSQARMWLWARAAAEETMSVSRDQQVHRLAQGPRDKKERPHQRPRKLQRAHDLECGSRTGVSIAAIDEYHGIQRLGVEAVGAE